MHHHSSSIMAMAGQQQQQQHQQKANSSPPLLLPRGSLPPQDTTAAVHWPHHKVITKKASISKSPPLSNIKPTISPQSINLSIYTSHPHTHKKGISSNPTNSITLTTFLFQSSKLYTSPSSHSGISTQSFNLYIYIYTTHTLARKV